LKTPIARYSQLANALALAGAFLVAGFLVTRIAFDKNPVARFLAQLASFAGFTIMLFAAGALPSEATPKGDPNFEYLAISVFKIVWWLAAAWLSAGFFCAVLVFKGQPRGTRFPGDLVVGAVYVTAVLAIVADVVDMPVGGLRRYRHCARPRASEPLGGVFSGVVLNLAKPYRPGADRGAYRAVGKRAWKQRRIPCRRWC
jgi:hypothetical protein